MPFIFDFNNSIGDNHLIDIDVDGWKSPITIEYCVVQVHKFDPVLSVVWRIKGTEHCFTIEEQRLNNISNGNYKEHFRQALIGFRKDYLSWFTREEYSNCDWKYEYEHQYGKFIIPDKDQNNKSKSK